MKNKHKDTASQLLGISDDWTINDIEEHYLWLMANPEEIADGYDKTTFNSESFMDVMDWVKILKHQASTTQHCIFTSTDKNNGYEKQNQKTKIGRAHV